MKISPLHHIFGNGTLLFCWVNHPIHIIFNGNATITILNTKCKKWKPSADCSSEYRLDNLISSSLEVIGLISKSVNSSVFNFSYFNRRSFLCYIFNAYWVPILSVFAFDFLFLYLITRTSIVRRHVKVTIG